MNNETKPTLRKALSVLMGIGISVISFFIFVIFLVFAERSILWTLLCFSYISIILFLVLWNRKKRKIIYFLLLVPVICIAAGIAVVGYNNHIHTIPTVSEQLYNLGPYMPFRGNTLLAKLNENASLKLYENLPVLDGATALFPLYASFVQAVYPENQYNTWDRNSPILSSTTSGAYNNLLEGKADIIFCAGPSEMQLNQFIENDVNIKLIPIGKEAFVFFVNNENTINNLTIENIQGIYSGKIKNWRELNGVRQGIRAFQRPKNSGSQTMLEKIMGNIPIAKPRRENVSNGMGDIINQVAVYRNFPNAIGYSFLFFSTEMVKNDQIKLLSINNVYPSKETIQDNSYPFSDYFYAIYVEKENKNENIEPFIEWILSWQGQDLISKTGYIPIKRE